MTTVEVMGPEGGVFASTEARLVQTGRFRAENAGRVDPDGPDAMTRASAVRVGHLPPTDLDAKPSVGPEETLAFEPGHLVVEVPPRWRWSP